MAGRLPGRLLLRRENPGKTSFLELFFDLAFIFALTRLSRALLDDPSFNGGFQTLLMLAALWWVWFVTAWSADWFDPRAPLIVTLLLWTMFGGLLMAAGVPAIIVGGLATVRSPQLVNSAVVAGVLLLIVLFDAMPALRRSMRQPGESDAPNKRRHG